MLSKKRGFTVLELVVSSTIIVLMLTFVLANFRTARYSGDLDIALKQIKTGVSDTRTNGLSGNLATNPLAGQPGQEDEIYPSNGYAIRFTEDSKFTMYGLNGGSQLDAQTINFNDIRIIQLCGYPGDVALFPPCQSGWQDAGVFAEVSFDIAGDVTINTALGSDFNFVGGIVEHQQTNIRSYFYVSKASGLATVSKY